MMAYALTPHCHAAISPLRRLPRHYDMPLLQTLRRRAFVIIASCADFAIISDEPATFAISFSGYAPCRHDYLPP